MATKELISTVTVGAGGAASIDFTSIPQTFTDLMVVYSLRATSGGPYNLQNRLNGDTSASNFFIQFYGNGSTAASSKNGTGEIYLQGGVVDGSGDTANTFSNGQNYIPNYTGSAVKVMSVDSVTENNGTTAYPSLFAGRTGVTAAVTSISLSCSSNFAQYSSASLYGFKKGSDGITTVA